MANVTKDEVRLSYVNVWEPRANKEGEDPKYSVTLLIPKTAKDTVAQIATLIEEAKKEAVSKKWGGKMPAKVNIPIHDGDGLRDNDEPFGEECKGHYVMTASSRRKPQVVDRSVNAIINQDDLYSGCYARVSFTFFAYDSNGKKGIGCGLNNIQKIRDGERLAGGTTAQEDFTVIPEEYEYKGNSEVNLADLM